LANYHLKTNQLEQAYFAAQKCTEFFEVFLFTLCAFVAVGTLWRIQKILLGGLGAVPPVGEQGA